ncbi:metallophosphoesterase family protein [Paenibacillus nasutitermitis]|uniref:Phosphoesterase n=1 Tax=Paenibacillus nasutitermitis TaxID=1652958 RepID=A0A916YXI2_9BACL|nr:metallophosphoesterase [Paenibacillus nasutitermitis]GGD66034.1 phosphoesterase [Paenibacillus nasutitermitis]
MRIIIVSDTHMPRMNKKLPDRLVRELRSADHILHAGDWTQLSVYDMLAAYAPTDGVAGNNDGPEIIRKFGWRKLLTFQGVRIGMVHGHGTGKRTDTEATAVSSFADEKPDVILYGHSHIPVLRQSAGILVMNPGSPTDKRRQSQYSFGVLELTNGAVEAKHIYYGNKS